MKSQKPQKKTVVKSPLTLVLAISFEYDTKTQVTKEKIQKQDYKLKILYSQKKIKNQQHEKATYRMGEKYLQNT